jgi:hypothetical protein
VRSLAAPFRAGKPLRRILRLGRRRSPTCASMARPARHQSSGLGGLEAQALKPLAGRPPFQAARELIRRVQADCAVDIDGNTYSVPWRLIGESPTGWCASTIGIQEVAVHPICVGPRRRVVDPEHLQAWLALDRTVLASSHYRPLRRSRRRCCCRRRVRGNRRRGLLMRAAVPDCLSDILRPAGWAIGRG